MKRLLSILLAFVLLFSFASIGASAANTATQTSASVLVNGQSVSFEAYNIDGSNYFKLRDLAKALSGTEKQFDVGWDGTNNAIALTSGKAYTPVGGELTSSGQASTQSASLSSATVYLDGAKAPLTAYNIKNNNYFKLRDVASAINFGVGWDEKSSTITIDTTVGYSNGTGYLIVHFIDVGQGDSEFIELPSGKTMLIDAGESEYGNTVVNYIKNLGYSKIDYLVATHPHADHIGGMAKVVQSFSIGSIYMPFATTTTQTYSYLLSAIKSAGLTVTTAKAGVNMFNSNGLTADIIAPVGTGYDDLNNYSAVIKLTYKNNFFLFMGDAEELSEKEITTSVKADVLKVGHHGSNSSTGQAFLGKVNPKYAVISVGEGNDYGHPAQTTLDKLSSIGATTYRTDKNGTVIFKSNGTDISVSTSNYASPSPSPTTKPTPTPTPAPTKPVTITPQPTTPIVMTVYVTKTGSKYHLDGCRYLSKSKIAISLSDAKSQGYTPCSVCNPPS
ncbi:MAG: MBL fold metallo-hydrolase [Oscillospiraceae bacterium]|nr:MBL fold metallo-hydrolase [Oscillospiraceae bacterium]